MNSRTLDTSRRRFLRGAGSIAVGLPFMEALATRKAWAAPAKRFAILFQCNGVNMEKFWPAQYGALTEASLMGTALEPLGKHAAKLLIPRGIAMTPKGFGQDPIPGCDHQKGMGCKLTCAPLKSAGGYPNGPSIDLTIAKSINPGGKSPLNLRVGGGGTGPLSSAFYTESGQPAAMQSKPWDAYKDWMGMGTKMGAVTVDLTAKRRASVLDAVREDMSTLKTGGFLSTKDIQKLDLHATSIRQLETNMMAAGGAAVNGCGLGDAKSKEIMDQNNGAYEVIAPLMMEIMGIAMACDYNRVTTCQFGSGSGGPVYKWLGDKLNQMYNHHKLSHGATTDAATAANLPEMEYKLSLFNIDQWHMKQMKVLLDRLASYSEPGGTVLDNSVVLYNNELSHGLQHHFADLPIVIAGSGGGALKQGQLIKMTAGSTNSLSEVPANQLYVTLAGALGYKDDKGAPMSNFGTFINGKSGDLIKMKA